MCHYSHCAIPRVMFDNVEISKMSDVTNTPAQVPVKVPAKVPAKKTPATARVEVAPAIQRLLDDHKKKIFGLVRKTVENLMEIGKHLIDARGQCPKGHWGTWLKEIKMADQTAQKLMTVARAFSKLHGEGATKGVSINELKELPWGLREVYLIARQVDAAPSLAKKQDVIKKSLSGKKTEERIKAAARDRRKADRAAGKKTQPMTAKGKRPDIGHLLKVLGDDIGVFEDLVKDITENLSVTNRTAIVDDLVKSNHRIADLIKKIRPPKTITVKPNKVTVKEEPAKEPAEPTA